MSAVKQSRCDADTSQDTAIQTVNVKDVARIDSRRLAVNVHKAHKSLFELVKAFGEARRAAQLRSAEYLPGYHDLHDQIHALASGSPNERFVHANFNRLVNKAVGIDAGQRTVLKSTPLSLVMVTQAIVTKAMQGAKDHHDAYSRAKNALGGFAALIGEAA